MKTGLVLLSVLLATSPAPHSPPDAATSAALRCLEEKRFLVSSGVAPMLVAAWLDERSYPGERVLYLAHYRSESRRSGWIFVLFREGTGWTVANNAAFEVSGDKSGRVEFTGTGQPLGGTWTQTHVELAIKRLAEQPLHSVGRDQLQREDAAQGCSAYTDPQPK